MNNIKQRKKLNQFVRENKQALAALSWGLREEWGETEDCLGIDLLPEPHFVRCPRKSLEELNRNVESKIQEVLGILDGYKPTEEVVIITIGKGQIELIHYKVDLLPEVSLQEFKGDLDGLIQLLEERMKGLLN